jgi:hypothetical protein
MPHKKVLGIVLVLMSLGLLAWAFEAPADGKPLVKPIKPADDKQLQRAMDVMRAAAIWKEYEDHEPVRVAAPKPHDTSKKAA